MIKRVLGVFKNIKITKRALLLISYVLVSVMLIASCVVFSDAVLAYNVEYDGNVIAQIENVKVFENAKKIAMKNIASDNADSYIETPKLTLTLTMPDRIDNTEEMVEVILTNAEKLVKSSALIVDGEQVAFHKDGKAIQEKLNTKLSQYNTEGFENTSKFVQSVEISEVYCPIDQFSTEEELLETINALTVETTTKVTTEVSIPYSSVTKKNSSKLVGYYAVTQKGVKGINHTVEEVVYINGKEIKRTELAQEVVKKPVNEIIEVGTATTGTSSGMIFPLPKSTNYVITTYFGQTDSIHSTPHKGVDYAAPYDTNILAAKGGTVISAGYNSGYGYHVIINHGNGVRTLYAHANKLLVTKGEEVTAGQIIAKVGSTGWSTGNHLHFEVIINGRYVNPRLYV